MGYACGTLTITTGAVGTTFTVDTLSFQPKAIKLSWSGRSGGVGAGEATHRRGVGFAVSTSSRRAYTQASEHGAGTSSAFTAKYNDSCIATVVAGAIEGKADLDAMLSNGFRLIIDDQFATALEVQWEAWDVTNAQIVDFNDPGSTGNQDIATSFALDTGIDDKCVIIAGYSSAAFGTVDAYSAYMLGFAAGDTPVGAVLAGNGTTAAVAALTNSYCRAGECIATVYDDVVQSQATLSAWLSTGFRLNWSNVDATIIGFSALVLQGGMRFEVGSATTRTDTTQHQVGTTYAPAGLMIISAGKPASAAGVADAHDETSIGYASSATSRSAVSLVDADAADPTDIATGFHADRVYTNYDQSNADKSTVHGIMDIVSFDNPGFTFVMDDADNAANFFAFVLSADIGGGGGGGSTDPFVTVLIKPAP